MGLPSGARYCVSSIISSPSFMRATRMRKPKTPCSFSYSAPCTSTSLTFSKLSTLEKNSTERSISETVMPTASTDFTICAAAELDTATSTATKTSTRPNLLLVASRLTPGSLFHSLDQVFTHAQRIGHDRQRRIDGAAGDEEATVDDVKIIQIVRSAVHIERARLGIATETHRADLMCDAG